jgi:flagella basal body P-ring formation protein FlgA
MVIYQTGGVTLSMRTQAMQDAAIGQSVRLMNTSSNRIVLGVVTGPGAANASP